MAAQQDNPTTRNLCKLGSPVNASQIYVERPTASSTLLSSLLATTHVFAAAAATQEELEEARKKRKLEKSKPIEPDRRIWRPQVASRYMEPDCIPDPLGDLEILYKEYGKPLWANKSQLPPRDDLISYDPAKHKDELDRNLIWGDCPLDKQPLIKELVMEFWDVFAEEGVRKNIRGLQFHVGTA